MSFVQVPEWLLNKYLWNICPHCLLSEQFLWNLKVFLIYQVPSVYCLLLMRWELPPQELPEAASLFCTFDCVPPLQFSPILECSLLSSPSPSIHSPNQQICTSIYFASNSIQETRSIAGEPSDTFRDKAACRNQGHWQRSASGVQGKESTVAWS